MDPLKLPNFQFKNNVETLNRALDHMELQTYILQLLCKSGTDKLDDAFCVADWYFWAAAPSWLTCICQIFIVK